MADDNTSFSDWRNSTAIEISDDESDGLIDSSLLKKSDVVIPESESSTSQTGVLDDSPLRIKKNPCVISSDSEGETDNKSNNSDDHWKIISGNVKLQNTSHRLELNNEDGLTDTLLNSTLDDEDEKTVEIDHGKTYLRWEYYCPNSSASTEVNEDCATPKRNLSVDKCFNNSPALQNISSSKSLKNEGETLENLSQNRSLEENVEFLHKADDSYFNAETQLAIIESLNDDSRKLLKEETASSDIRSPAYKKLKNSNFQNHSPMFKLQHEKSVINLSALSLSDDIVGNKENLLAEKERLEYEIMMVNKAITDKKRTLKRVNLDVLPDKGMKLKISLDREERSLNTLNEQLNRVRSNLDSVLKNSINKKYAPTEIPPKFASLPSANLQDMGERALENHRVEQALTVDALRNLHSSLNNCPSDDQFVPDPDGLKIPLMDHQKQALAWLIWRENEKPSGGILADDMGLGKTLTMISLILKRKEEDQESDDDYDDDDDDDISSSARRYKHKGGTLIVCPSSLIGQWETEIQQRVKRGLLTYVVHHGQKREKKPRRLAKLDVVITSYPIVLSEFQNSSIASDKSTAALFSVKWQRIVLDEAHIIRNHKTKTAEAVFKLKSFHRWALTGTPVHNKTQDFYALLKFLRCKPFDDLNIWKKWVEAKDETGSKRLNTLTKSLMLRRTKDVLMSEGKLESLPEKSSQIINVHLSKEELILYEEVSNFSKTLLSQLLYERAQKEQLLTNGFQVPRNKINLPEKENIFNKHPALNKLYNRVVNMQNVKTHEILVLLLRLRQICCHPALMKSLIEEEVITQGGVEDEDGTDADLLEKMSAVKVDEDDEGDGSDDLENSISETFRKNILNPNNHIFNPDWTSSKIKAILKLLEEKLLNTDDKIVIVSQWTSMLDLIHNFLQKFRNCKCECLTGKVPVDQRMSIVSEFNRSSSSIKVLLLSLTAGGTGLNLAGGNHLILTDLHWNPQLEAQACDRIYRMGQTKPVTIYKFICSDTIEERIQLLQNDKLAVAEGVLSGAKQLQVAKLSLNDLKMLFNVG